MRPYEQFQALQDALDKKLDDLFDFGKRRGSEAANDCWPFRHSA